MLRQIQRYVMYSRGGIYVTPLLDLLYNKHLAFKNRNNERLKPNLRTIRIFLSFWHMKLIVAMQMLVYDWLVNVTQRFLHFPL